MDEANKFINQENQRVSFNSVNDFKSENKKIEEDVADNILNDFTIEHPREFNHLFYPNTIDKINKQSQYEEEQKRKLDIVLNERQHKIEKEMIFDAKMLKNTIWKSNFKKQRKEWSSKTIWRLSLKD